METHFWERLGTGNADSFSDLVTCSESVTGDSAEECNDLEAGILCGLIALIEALDRVASAIDAR